MSYAHIFTHCLPAFLSDPFKLSITISSLLIAFVLFVIIKEANISVLKRTLLVYAHLFALIFPLGFFIFSMTCQMTFSCHTLEAIIYAIPLTLLISGLLGFFMMPYLYKYTNKSIEIKNNFIYDFVRKYSNQLGIKKPKIYLFNSSKPIAFSFSSFTKSIFLSIGLIELFNKKEIEAVLLHELSHIKNKSSVLKFSTFLVKISPFSFLSSFNSVLNKEEEKADKYVIKMQKTTKYLTAAKNKSI